jgi:WD40 repeat protein
LALALVAQPPAGTSKESVRGAEAKPRPPTFVPCDEGAITTMGFSPDGNTLAVGYVRGPKTGGGVVLVDLTRRKRALDRPLRVPEGSVRSIAFSPDRKKLAAGYAYVHGYYSDGGMVIWDLASHERLIHAPLPRKGNQVAAVAFSPDGKSLAAAYLIDPRIGGGVILWDVPGRKDAQEKLLPVTEGTVTSIVFSPDSKTLAAGTTPVRPSGGDGGIALWDVAGRKLLVQTPLATPGSSVGQVVFSADGKELAAGYFRIARDGGGVAIWNLAERRFASDDPLPVTEGQLRSLLLSLDGKTLAAGFSPSSISHGEGEVLLWDVPGRKPLADSRKQVPAGREHNLAFSPDGKTLGSVFIRNARLSPLEPERETLIRAVLWNVRERGLVLDQTLPVTYGAVSRFALSPDCKTLLASYSFPRGLTSTNGILLWDLDASPKDR